MRRTSICHERRVRGSRRAPAVSASGDGGHATSVAIRNVHSSATVLVGVDPVARCGIDRTPWPRQLSTPSVCAASTRSARIWQTGTGRSHVLHA